MGAVTLAPPAAWFGLEKGDQDDHRAVSPWDSSQMNLYPASNTATKHPPGHCLLMNKVRKVPRPTSADHLVCDPPLPLDPKQPLTRSKLYIHFPIISFLSPGLHLQPQNKPRL